MLSQRNHHVISENLGLRFDSVRNLLVTSTVCSFHQVFKLFYALVLHHIYSDIFPVSLAKECKLHTEQSAQYLHDRI